MAFVTYVYFLSKFVEFMDTIFFILRKKFSQITTLHVYHHATVPLVAWYSTKYGAGGYNVFYMMLNVFVHIWMYSYYGLSGLDPSLQKYLWWKKYITRMQIVQFLMMLTHMTQAYLFPVEGCHFNVTLVAPTFIVCSQYLYLFTRFYLSTYKKQTSAKQS